MKKSNLIGALCAAVFSFIAMPCHAVLTPVLGGQAYYDDVADLTWLTNPTAAGSQMNWVDANAWAASLNVDGVTGWRLPNTLNPDPSCTNDPSGNITPPPNTELPNNWNCTGSELGNMFYNVLGGVAGVNIGTTHNSNFDLFYALNSYSFWSATELNTTLAYQLVFGGGAQYGIQKTSTVYAWAVHTGNAGDSVVPVPAAVWLFGSGLLFLIGVARRNSRA